MATIQTRTTAKGETRYRVLVRVQGAPLQTATFRRKTDARRWAEQTESDIRRGKYFFDAQGTRHTLAELIEAYEREKLQFLSPAERRNRKTQLDWWQRSLGSTRLSDLRPSAIAEARRRLAKRGPHGSPLTPATQNRYVACLSAALSYGVAELEWLENNPAKKIRRVPEPRGRVRMLNEAERGRLLESSQASTEPRLYPLVLVAISTGMRRREILRLRWEDLDETRGVAIIHETKNGTRRAVPLPVPAWNALLDLPHASPGTIGLVFDNGRGKAPFPKSAWYRAVEAADLRDFKFHDCRHTAASYLAMSGATLAEIADILGHKTLQMVKRYAHLTEQHTVAVSNRMAERFLG